MTAGMATLYGLGYVFGGGFLLCGLLAFAYAVRDWLRKLRTKLRKHRPDCACPDCWDRWCERLVDQFDWTAAEHDIAWRRP